MFKWLTTKPLWFNLLAAIAFILLLGVIFFISLGFITRHGETVKVPDVISKSFASAKATLESTGFDVIVQDSAFADSLPGLAVLRQTPDPESVVKVNRTVYLTLNKTVPPTVAMPDLAGLTFRSAQMTLESKKLSVGDTLHKPDFSTTVLDQSFDGKPVKPGTLIPEGSKIGLVIGNGLGSVSFPIPDFVGLTLSQAKDLLSANNLSLELVLTDGTVSDTANAYVFKQSPPKQTAGGQQNYVKAGEGIDLWISQTMKSATDTAAVSH